MMIKALGNVPGHLHMLNLITSDRHLMGVKNQDIGGHQNRVRKQAHGDAKIRVFARFHVRLHRGFIGVSTVHQALGRQARQHPAQLSDFGDVRLAVKKSSLGI